MVGKKGWSRPTSKQTTKAQDPASLPGAIKRGSGVNSSRVAAVVAAAAAENFIKNRTSSSVPATSADLAKISDTALGHRLPPSMTADPMKIINLEIVSLAFGHASTEKKRKATYGGEIDHYMLQTGGAGVAGMTAEAAAMARRRQEVQPPKKAKSQPTRDTQVAQQKELERKWAVETHDVRGTFHAMRQELLQREREAGLRDGDIALSREYSYYDLVGSAQLAAVELDLADVVASVREAGDRARTLLEQEPTAPEKADTTKPKGMDHEKETQPAKSTPETSNKLEDMDVDKKSQPAKPASGTSNKPEDMDVDKEPQPAKPETDTSKPKEVDPLEESLLCAENDLEILKDDPEVQTSPAKGAKIATNTTREKTIVQAAEDAAMMRELARIIRRRALEMPAARSSPYGLAP